MATIRIVGPRFIQEFVLGHSFSDVMKSKIEEDPKSTSQVSKSSESSVDEKVFSRRNRSQSPYLVQVTANTACVGRDDERTIKRKWKERGEGGGWRMKGVVNCVLSAVCSLLEAGLAKYRSALAFNT